LREVLEDFEIVGALSPGRRKAFLNGFGGDAPTPPESPGAQPESLDEF
jgi:hypothetical protein